MAMNGGGAGTTVISSWRLLAPRGVLPSSCARVFFARRGFQTGSTSILMPKRMAAETVELSLKHCRRQAEALDDPVLLYLIDMALLHIRRKPVRPEDRSTAWAIPGGCTSMRH